MKSLRNTCLVLFASLYSLFGEPSDRIADSHNNTAEKSDLIAMAAQIDKQNKYIDAGGSQYDDQYEEITEQFCKLVRQHFDSFQEIKATYATGTNTFQEIKLNKCGAGFDAIRFKNGTTDTKDLVWILNLPNDSKFDQWYIVPKTGGMRGFRNFWRSTALYSGTPWAKAGTHRSILQALRGEQIKSNTEYLIWFTFKSAEPATLHVALNLVRPGTRLEGLYEQETALGLRRADSSNP